MFTQGCFIRKSSNDIRIKLEKLGYRLFGPYLNEDLCLFTEPKYSLYSVEFFSNIPHPEETDYIDCGTNEYLFLAIASLRDDSDIYQWFVVEGVDGKKFIRSVENSFTYDTAHNVWHKATVEELINYFNKQNV